jgi:hypothetical protein
MASRPSRDSSDMIRTWNGGRGLSAAMRRTKPGPLPNSAPLTNPVVDENARLGDRPALALGVGFCVRDLPRDGLRLVGDRTLVGALARVNGCYQVCT